MVAEPGGQDPFGTAELREATLAAWRSSPTRLAEDVAAEAELRSIGYRGALFTELAANAADAAAAAGRDGRVRAWCDGAALHVANVGQPLGRAGVQGLTALRVSPKAASQGVVGRFGLGFRATSFLDRVEIRSASGSIEFDRRRAEALAQAAGVTGPVPAQRLAWPSLRRPVDGYDTEVVLHTADSAAADALLAELRRQAPDLLLELPVLAEIIVDDVLISAAVEGGFTVIERRPELDPEPGEPADREVLARWLVAAAGGTRWLVPVDDRGAVLPLAGDVLRSPTPTQVPLTLPARVITDLPVTPDRRDLHPDADIAAAAPGYPELVALADAQDRLDLIPAPGFAAGTADAALRTAVTTALSSSYWVPGATGEVLRPDRTLVLRDVSADLADCLGEVVGSLAGPAVSDSHRIARLLALGAREVGLADVADLLGGVTRPPVWWARLYAALDPLVVGGAAAAELGALPVPGTDGRMRRGVRGVRLIDGAPSGLRFPWVPAVDPAAYHPLLERIGLEHACLADVLADPVLAQLLDDDPADPGIRDAVLGALASDPGPVPTWLGRLELPDAEGELTPADELLLPSSPLADVLVDDAPFGVVAGALVAEYGEEALTALGVGRGFAILSDALPVAPDHDLPDEERWWRSLEIPPADLVAVRDLDLVDADRWPAALSMLLDDPACAALLADPDGYTAWWLRRYATIGGVPLRNLRRPGDDRFAGLFDEFGHPRADALAGLLAGGTCPGPEDADDAQAWLDALADAGRAVSPGVAARAHTALVAGLRAGRFGIDNVYPPTAVRTLAGTVAADAVVVDQPWFADVLDPDDAVIAGLPVDAADAGVFADLTDLPSASQVCAVVVDGPGEPLAADAPAAVALAARTGWELAGPLRRHAELVVTVLRDGRETARRVPRWRDDAGVLHVEIPAGASD